MEKMDTELILLCKALLEAYKNLDYEEIVLEPQEIIVLKRK
jgi:hypothetical protein